MMSAKILIIEDNPDNVELMIYLLERYGFHYFIATDGKSGYEAVRNYFPDLVICDIQLPIMDGYEIIKKIKADKNLKLIPFIALTSMAIVGDKEKILSAGFDSYISKPINIDIFFDQVNQFLKRK